MYVPADRLIHALMDELSAHFGSDRTEASLGQSALSALRLLAAGTAPALADKLRDGELPDLKLAYTRHYHFPLFIKAAWDLIEAGPDGAVAVDY